MNGITAAFTGRIGADATTRTTRDGKPWASFSVAVDTDKDRSRYELGASSALRRFRGRASTAACQGHRGLLRAAIDLAPMDGCEWKREGGAFPRDRYGAAHGADWATAAGEAETRSA
jgi:hypothetical protein